MTTTTLPFRLRAAKPLIGPVADAFLIWGAPAWALLIGALIPLLPATTNSVTLFNHPLILTTLAASALTDAHLVIVGFRSHANRDVFARHKLRFTLVPLVMFGAMLASVEVTMVLALVGIFWDYYHSALQTFGLGRIYDSRVGADPNRDRLVDILFNHAVYTLPWFLGPAFLVVALPGFEQLYQSNITVLDPLVRFRLDNDDAFRAAMFAVVPVAVLAYVMRQMWRVKRGEPVAWQKVALLVVTVPVTLWSFCFGFFGRALIVVNVFHAVQYFGIVWATEKKTVSRVLGVPSAALGLVVIGAVYGIGGAVLFKHWAPTPAVAHVVWAVRTTVALMHYWYDGFVWSVRKKQVT